MQQSVIEMIQCKKHNCITNNRWHFVWHRSWKDAVRQCLL